MNTDEILDIIWRSVVRIRWFDDSTPGGFETATGFLFASQGWYFLFSAAHALKQIPAKHHFQINAGVTNGIIDALMPDAENILDFQTMDRKAMSKIEDGSAWAATTSENWGDVMAMALSTLTVANLRACGKGFLEAKSFDLTTLLEGTPETYVCGINMNDQPLECRITEIKGLAYPCSEFNNLNMWFNKLPDENGTFPCFKGMSGGPVVSIFEGDFRVIGLQSSQNGNRTHIAPVIRAIQNLEKILPDFPCQI